MNSTIIKKIFTKLCITAVSVTVLAGCSNNKNSSTESEDRTAATTKTTSESQQSEDTEAKTKIIETVNGDLEVPVNPQRVVVNWYIGDAFTLGLNIVGYNAWSHESMPFFDKFASSAKIENWAAEDILLLEPDLIITHSQDDYDNFSKIAPVLVVPEGDITSVERLKIIGEATGRTKEAEAAISQFETRLAAAKEKLTSNEFTNKTFSIFEDWGPSSYGIYFETGSRGGTLLYSYLGLKKPEILEDLIESSGEGRGSLSYEVAAKYFGDYVLWFLQEDYESEFAQTEIWKSIPAVKEGRVIEIPGEYQGLFYYSDVTSLTAQLDYIIDTLNSNVE